MDTRTLLLEQACALFSRRGYDAVGVLELAQAGGVSKPTLYHYFESKKGLLDTLLREYGAPLLARLRAEADYRGDLPLTLERLAFGFLAAARERPDFYRMFLALCFAPRDNEAHQAVAGLMASLTTLVEGVFAQAVAQHGNMRDRQSAYAISWLSLVHGLVGRELGGGPALEDHEVRRMVHWFQHGIYS